MSETFKTYRIGDLLVTRVTETLIDFTPPERLFPNWDEAVIEDREDRLAPSGLDSLRKTIRTSVHTWVLKTPDHTILVDTGIGNGKARASAYFNQLHTPYLEKLQAAGVVPEGVDYVLLTHIHTDHVGWNTTLVDGLWRPTFANATYFVPRSGIEYFSSAAGRSKPNYDMYRDSVLPVVEAGQAQMVGPEGGEVLPGIVYQPTPGHSVDHMSITLTSGNEEGLLAGDIMHNPVQVYRPQWNSIFCATAEEAVRSRERMLALCADRRAIYLSSHFAETSAGRITRTDQGYDWRFE